MMGEQLVLALPVLACTVAVYNDLRSREIPDWLPIMLVALLPARLLVMHDLMPWWHHISGGVAALLLGLLVGYGERFGGGDIKLFAALGIWFGLFAVIPLALWIAIAGLPLAIIAALRKQSDFAYAPAILAGVCVHVLVPDLLQRIAN